MTNTVAGSLLDTSVLIAAEIATEALPPSAAISVITLGELRAGVLLARNEAIRTGRQRRLDAVRAAFDPIPVDEDVVERFGEALAVARRERRSAKATDVLIIATAAATNRVLHTLDGGQAKLAAAAGIATVVI